MTFAPKPTGWRFPYGVYDIPANRGTVFVGTSHDTPEFAVDAIEQWWRSEGRPRYGRIPALAILADAGGSNAPGCKAWKLGLQRKLCQLHGLTVTVAHYPSGASKWNPIEHRLFSEISKNWAGRPLDSYDTILNYIRTTRTSTGLRLRAHLVRKHYEKGTRITDKVMRSLPIVKDPTLPRWNYVISPS